MNYRLIAVTVLTVSMLSDVSVSANTSDMTTQSTFSGVSVQKSREGEKVMYEKKGTFGTEVIDSKHRGGEIVIPNGIACENQTFCDYGVSIYRGALSKEAVLKYQVVDSLPYEPLTKPLGYKSTITLDLASINKSAEQIDFLAIVTPTYSEEVFLTNLSNIKSELVIRLEDGREFIELRGYSLGQPVFITITDLIGSLGLSGTLSAQKLEISLMPIDTSALINNQNLEELSISSSINLRHKRKH